MTLRRARRSSILVSIMVMLVFSIFRRLLGLISIASLARLLTPAELGAYAFTQSTGQTFVGLFRFGALQGLHVSIARRLSDPEPCDMDELLGCGLVLICAIALVGIAFMVALAEPIASYIFGEPDLAPYVMVAAVFFTGQFLSRGAYVGYAGLGRFVDYAYFATAMGIATVTLTILGALIFGVQGAVWTFAGTTLVGAPVFFAGLLHAARAAGIRIRPSLRRDHLRQIFAIGLPFYGAGVFMIPAEFVAQGAISRFGGVEGLAELRVVLTLMAVVHLIPQAVSAPIISLFSEREGQEAGSGAASAFEHMRWLWIFSLMSGAMLAAIWPMAVVMIFGAGFPQATAVGQLAIIAFVPTIVGTSLSAGILVGGRTLPLVFVGLVQGGVLVGLAFPLVREIGLTGFFLAQTAASTAAMVLWLIVLGWQTRRSPLRPWMVPLTLATAALCAALVADIRLDQTDAERILASLVAVPAFCLAITFTALSGQERAALLAQARKAMAAGRGKVGGA